MTNRILRTLIYIALAFSATAMNFRQITTADGLTNSAILSLHSGPDGLLYIGTCDGLNISDGYAVYTSRMIPEFAAIPGNIIEDIVDAEPGTVWVQTNHGLSRISPRSNSSELFPQFHGQEMIMTAPDHSLFVLDENCDLSYCPKGGKTFTKLVNLQLDFHGIFDIKITDNLIRLHTRDGIFEYTLRKTSKGYAIGKPHKISDLHLHAASSDANNTIAVDTDGNVLLWSGIEHPADAICNIKEDRDRRGDISDMILDDSGNIFIAFRTGGLIKLVHDKNNVYHSEDLGVDIGIFCLEKSQLQNVVWAGTDCHGVYTFFDDPFTLKHLGFEKFSNKISHPVRALYLDDFNSLWVGTKGDGLLRVTKFNPLQGPLASDQTLYTKGNSNLSDNSVYAVSPSRRPLIWIASESGIDYFSYVDNSIHHVDVNGFPIYLVHGIQETNDSTLFISTTGNGIFKARISGPDGSPILTDFKQYTIEGGNMSSNYFFAQCLDDARHPVFGNRGYGIFTLDGDRLRSLQDLNAVSGEKSINDVFAVLRDNDIIWAGTGTGLVKISPEGQKIYAGVENGFLNNTIHSMLKDDYGNLWISTNKGLVRFNPATEDTHSYVTSYNITGNEFSDGAAFKSDSMLIFGGVDGIVTVERASPTPPGENYMPPLQVISLAVGGTSEPLTKHMTDRLMTEGECDLTLGPDQNYFSLVFSTPDFTNPDNYILFYTLDGEKWISNGNNRTLTFTKLNYGKNTLKVKYQNRETGEESRVYTLNIDVKTPWYVSWWAQLIYFLILAAIIIVIVRVYFLHQKAKQKNEVYESKIKFFSNISHELFTPLTLIYGTSDRLLADESTSPQARKHLNLIMSNTKRLNTLIQELVDFRKIESGHHKAVISPIDVSSLSNDICESFTVIAEHNNVNFSWEIQRELTFNTDREAITRIVTNLLSNAFKYTSPGGKVSLKVWEENNSLKLEVYNTGQGISEPDQKKIFNRFTILDNMERNAKNGLFSRNGLGLAICKSLVDMLDGQIEIESQVGSFALFRVMLPEKTPSPQTQETEDSQRELVVKESDEGENEFINMLPIHSQGRNNILVVDDNKEILTLLSETLTEYNIITATSADQALDLLKTVRINLIITDFMLPGRNGMTFTRNVKSNKHTMHIPIIIMSGQQTVSHKVEGLAAGADVYIGKPFEISYLRAIIYRLLEKQQTMREYFTTSASAFTYSNGQLQDKESNDFISKVAKFIDENIENEKLNAESIADHMQIGLRNLYRKFKDLDLPTPNEFIKTHKLSVAAKLLVTTSLTVQEIIYRSGFNNRSHFYREFFRYFNRTPKDYRVQNKKKSDFAEK